MCLIVHRTGFDLCSNVVSDQLDEATKGIWLTNSNFVDIYFLKRQVDDHSYPSLLEGVIRPCPQKVLIMKPSEGLQSPLGALALNVPRDWGIGRLKEFPFLPKKPEVAYKSLKGGFPCSVNV